MKNEIMFNTLLLWVDLLVSLNKYCLFKWLVLRVKGRMAAEFGHREILELLVDEACNVKAVDRKK